MKFKQAVIWTAALVVGGVLGALGVAPLDAFMDFVASLYTRCFQFVAIPTVALAILTAMASLGEGRAMGRVFAKTFACTCLTSFVAALVGLVLYLVVRPGTIAADAIAAVSGDAGAMAQISRAPETVYGHILNAVPNNLVNPFLNGNVLAIVLISAGIGIAIAVLGKTSENVRALHKALVGLQEVFFGLVKGLGRSRRASSPLRRSSRRRCRPASSSARSASTSSSSSAAT
ncbi:MAG: cation:dicarboxylase symporter family transporter [Kiritimatiellae bacterium]|nr:cation:dicarboxylase symporter family transporter [Kiritimatiellia bacterium]